MIEESDGDFYIPPALKRDLGLDDDDIPEYWPHLRKNREKRYREARDILYNQRIREQEFRSTLIDILELPEILYHEDDIYGD